jgi:hypothetical protein
MPGSSPKARIGAICRGLLVLLAAVPVACDDELADDSCSPGELRCNVHQSETCNGRGTWDSRIIVGQCGAVCTFGASRCNGQQYETCNDHGTWDGRSIAGQCGAI